jgi:hypothetical protein
MLTLVRWSWWYVRATEYGVHPMDHDELVNKRVRRIAKDHGCSVAEVHAALDQHPIELDRDKYLRRTLGLELLKLDELEEAFRSKAILQKDTGRRRAAGQDIRAAPNIARTRSAAGPCGADRAARAGRCAVEF